MEICWFRHPHLHDLLGKSCKCTADEHHLLNQRYISETNNALLLEGRIINDAVRNMQDNSLRDYLRGLERTFHRINRGGLDEHHRCAELHNLGASLWLVIGCDHKHGHIQQSRLTL